MVAYMHNVSPALPQPNLTTTGYQVQVQEPNKAASIAWANRSFALLCVENRTRADLEESLECAERATKLNPEYVKGHHRKMKALEALGRKEEAAEILLEIKVSSLYAIYGRAAYACF